MTYHISKNGIPQICKAQEGKCPLGTKHFDNLEEASIHADSLNEKTELISRFKNAKTPGQRLKTRKLIWNLNEKLGLEKNNGIPETKKYLPNLDKIKEIKKSEEEKTLKNIKNFEDLEYIKMPENIQKNYSNYLYKEKYFSRQNMYKSVYRGEMGATNKDYNTGTAMYGQGRYTTTNKKYASKFGKVRTVEYEEMPAIPLSFKNVTSFEMFEQELAKEHGIRKNDLYRNHDLSTIIKKMGYDGITIGPKSDMIIVSYETKKGD